MMTTNAHPGLPEFDYIKPNSLVEASQFLVQHSEAARPFLGGTDVFVRMRDGLWKEKFLVDVKNLDGTNELSFDPQLGLRLGAAVEGRGVRDHRPSPVIVRSLSSYLGPG